MPLYCTFDGDKHPLICSEKLSSQYRVRDQKPQGRRQGINKRVANFSHFACRIIVVNMRENMLSHGMYRYLNEVGIFLPQGYHSTSA